MTYAPDETFAILGIFSVFGGCVRFSVGAGACGDDHSSTRRYFQHAHFIPVLGVEKRGAY